MRKSRILFVIGTLDVGGAETQLVELASRIDRARFEPLVCCISSGGDLVDTLRDRGVPTILLNFKRAFPGFFGYVCSMPRMFRMVWRFWRLVRRERPDIIHGILLAAYIMGTFIGRLAGTPIVIAGRRSLGLFKENKHLYLMLERLADRMTDLFIANSEAVRIDTLEREPVDASDIMVIYNGLDLTRFEGDPDPALVTELGLGDGPRAIVVSNFIEYKGHEYFLRAWAGVLEVFPNAMVLLVGGGPLRPHIERLAEQLNITRSVRFLGVRHDVPALLAVSEIYVHPSFQEGYSNSLLEAMAAGRAVIATAVGGNVEAVSEGVTGALVPPKDAPALQSAMLRLFSNPDVAREMGRRAKASVTARHEMGAMIRSYEAVYHRLLLRAGRLDHQDAGHEAPAS
jgi:glycosyltransferase involved in cell wall biosynthesis